MAVKWGGQKKKERRVMDRVEVSERNSHERGEKENKSPGKTGQQIYI
jgi:hypothetical protein